MIPDGRFVRIVQTYLAYLAIQGLSGSVGVGYVIPQLKAFE
jgi:hypothetical protein